MDIHGKHVAILVDNYFEQPEFEEPLSALEDAGAEVTVISTGEDKVQGMHHAEPGDSFSVDEKLERASSGDYDAVVLPGGGINADALRMNEAAQSFVADFLNSGRPVAAICHAPWLLVSADLVEGRRLTSYETIQDDIKNAGGEWVDAPVVVDENLITSRKPDDLPDFNQAIIEALTKKVDVATATVTDMPALGSEISTEEEIRLRALGYDPAVDELASDDEADILADTAQEDNDSFYLSDIVSEDENDR